MNISKLNSIIRFFFPQPFISKINENIWWRKKKYVMVQIYKKWVDNRYQIDKGKEKTNYIS